MGTQNGHNVPFLESASHKKRKRKVMKSVRGEFLSLYIYLVGAVIPFISFYRVPALPLYFL